MARSEKPREAMAERDVDEVVADDVGSEEDEGGEADNDDEDREADNNDGGLEGGARSGGRHGEDDGGGGAPPSTDRCRSKRGGEVDVDVVNAGATGGGGRAGDAPTVPLGFTIRVRDSHSGRNLGSFDFNLNLSVSVSASSSRRGSGGPGTTTSAGSDVTLSVSPVVSLAVQERRASKRKRRAARDEDDAEQLRETSGLLGCPNCGRRFRSRGGLGGHLVHCGRTKNDDESTPEEGPSLPPAFPPPLPHPSPQCDNAATASAAAPVAAAAEADAEDVSAASTIFPTPLPPRCHRLPPLLRTTEGPKPDGRRNNRGSSVRRTFTAAQKLSYIETYERARSEAEEDAKSRGAWTGKALTVHAFVERERLPKTFLKYLGESSTGWRNPVIRARIEEAARDKATAGVLRLRKTQSQKTHTQKGKRGRKEKFFISW